MLTYNPESERLSHFRINNPSDSSELIDVYFKKFKNTDYGSLVSQIEIIQGGKDRYQFDFDSLIVNNQTIKFEKQKSE